MKKHFYLVINGQAGSGNGKRTASKVIKQLKLTNQKFTAYYTEYVQHEIEIVRTLATNHLKAWNEQINDKTFPLLVIFGGDGTLHNALNALHLFDSAIPIGYVPCGSGNDFARGVGIDLQGIKAFAQLAKAEQPRNIQVIHYQENIAQLDGLATNNVGIGIDAKVVHVTNNSISKHQLNQFRLGAFSYVFSILSVLLTKKSFPILIELNGKELHFDRAFLCTITNHPYFGGGIAIAPTATPLDDKIDLVVVERINIFKIFWLIGLVLRKKQLQSKYFHHYRSKKIRVVSTIPQYIHADGEIVGKQNVDMLIWSEQRSFWF